MKNTIKNYIMLTILYILNKVNRVRIYLGLLEMKYNIIGYFNYKGLHLSNVVDIKERLEACADYDNFKPDDVVLMTYPKTGTHFTAEVILSIYKEKGLIEYDSDLISSVVTFEAQHPKIMGAKSGDGSHPLSNIDAASSPRIIGTHLPWDFLPKRVRNGEVKVIHCTRNPKDTVCSYFPFLKKMGVIASETTWNEFVTDFMNGTVIYGGYFDWLRQWYPNRDNSRILNLTFESMKKDLEENVKKVAKFLNMELTQQQIDRVVTANTFENKKKEMGSNHPMYRTGKSGGWRSEITVEQNDMLDQWIEAEMKGMEDLELQDMSTTQCL